LPPPPNAVGTWNPANGELVVEVDVVRGKGKGKVEVAVEVEEEVEVEGPVYDTGLRVVRPLPWPGRALSSPPPLPLKDKAPNRSRGVAPPLICVEPFRCAAAEPDEDEVVEAPVPERR
jgi:hypothetical protein